jgi:GNAT superfamily N-acetyltransferase
MHFKILGYPGDGPTLDLDHEQFAYAGKFVMSKTGKSVACDADEIVGAVAFNEDRSNAEAMRLRYVTVREDRRGEGVGPRLLRFTANALRSDTDQVLIAVNNPIAYLACYRAGFVSTGEETGMAEILLRYAPEADRSSERYNDGLSIFQRRDLPQRQLSVLNRYLEAAPPEIVPVPG